VRAWSEASEWEYREREEHLAQMAEEEARLGGVGRHRVFLFLGGDLLFLYFPFSEITIKPFPQSSIRSLVLIKILVNLHKR